MDLSCALTSVRFQAKNLLHSKGILGGNGGDGTGSVQSQDRERLEVCLNSCSSARVRTTNGKHDFWHSIPFVALGLRYLLFCRLHHLVGKLVLLSNLQGLAVEAGLHMLLKGLHGSFLLHL